MKDTSGPHNDEKGLTWSTKKYTGGPHNDEKGLTESTKTLVGPIMMKRGSRSPQRH